MKLKKSRPMFGFVSKLKSRRERNAGAGLLRSLFYEAALPYHELDRQGRIRRVNRSECRMLGFRATNLIGKPIWELCVEAQREECRRAVLGKLAGQLPVEPVERQYLRGNGDRITVCVYESLIRDARGEVTGLRAAVLDTTPVHRTERALAAREARFRNLFDNAPVGIYRTSPDGRMLLANPTLVRILGYASFEELAARDFERETIHPSYDRGPSAASSSALARSTAVKRCGSRAAGGPSPFAKARE